MSIVSTLVLMVTGIVARAGPDDLKAQNDDLVRRCEEALEQARRWEELANSWQARYEQEREIAAQRMAQHMAQALAQQADLARYSQAAAQRRGQLDLHSSFQEFCNCVPARHDMFLPR